MAARDEQLARYARWEYGPGSAAWILAEIRREARGARRGLRAWLGRRGRKARPTVAVTPRGQAASRTAADGGTSLLFLSREACPHEAWEPLGSGGNAHYYRCGDCGQVFIAQGGRLWTLRSLEDPEHEEGLAPSL